MDTELVDAAATLNPVAGLRSLDAIHLASAMVVRADLRAVVKYDTRMIAAAETLKLSVVAPARTMGAGLRDDREASAGDETPLQPRFRVASRSGVQVYPARPARRPGHS